MFEHTNVRKVKIMCVSIYLLGYNQNRSETNLLFTKTYSMCVCVFTSQLFQKSCSARSVCGMNTVKTIGLFVFFSPLGFEQVVVCIGKLPTPESSFQRSGPGRHNELGVDDTLN